MSDRAYRTYESSGEGRTRQCMGRAGRVAVRLDCVSSGYPNGCKNLETISVAGP